MSLNISLLKKLNTFMMLLRLTQHLSNVLGMQRAPQSEFQEVIVQMSEVSFLFDLKLRFGV